VSRCCWRIDDLAQRSGTTVDTIRYYMREGLLPSAERVGRNKLYGPDHLDRLTWIRKLQHRHFSLAAIRSLLREKDSPGLRAIFEDPGSDESYDFDQLVERAGATPEVVDALREAGLLLDPEVLGRLTYDGADLDVVSAAATLHELGMAPDAIAALARIYVQGLEAIQRHVLAFFHGDEAEEWGTTWQPGEAEAVRDRVSADAGRALDATRRFVEFAHRRTVQRLLLESVTAELDATLGDGTEVSHGTEVGHEGHLARS
jgi:DNA-binding transcriptional MerR regulator